MKWIILFSSLLIYQLIASEEDDPRCLIANHRYVEPLTDFANCSFAGSIEFSGPSSMSDGKFHDIAKKQLLSMQIVIDHVNQRQCGISINNSNYSLALRSFDDYSSKEWTKRISEYIIRKERPHNNHASRIIIGGYSSVLTEPLADAINGTIQSNISDKDDVDTDSDFSSFILLSPGSASTSVFKNRKTAFGLLPPMSQYTVEALKGLVKAGAKSVATTWENASFPRGVCGAVPELADKLGMNVTSSEEVRYDPSITDLEPVVERFSVENPDVVVSCLYSGKACIDWIKALRQRQWNPKAQVFTICVGLPQLKEELGKDVEYMMGVTPWSSSLSEKIRDTVTGWSAKEFHDRYKISSADLTYHTAAAAATISIAIQILQRRAEQMESYLISSNETDVNSKNNKLSKEREGTQVTLRDILVNSSFFTMYGNVMFDDNGQSKAPSLLIQYDEEDKIQTVYPENVRSASLLYPMPSWNYRDCKHVSRCASEKCQKDGSCLCDDASYEAKGIGKTALCSKIVEDPSRRALVLVLAIALPLVGMISIFGLVYYLFQEHNRKKYDSLWKVNKDELKFSNPAQVIGRGTFGMVYLAEYRGTQVAVKRVLPSIQEKKKMRSNGNKISTDGSQTNNMSRTDFDSLFNSWRTEEGDGAVFEDEMNTTTPSLLSSPKKGSSTNINITETSLRRQISDLEEGAINNSSVLNSTSSSLVGNAFTSKTFSSTQRQLKSKHWHKIMKKEFLEEMRYLSKLRHPCITTVMGAVFGDNKVEPMLVMEYMSHGSLHDILHNGTLVVIEEDVLLPILQDISQGVRFLHQATPQVIHGDLKSHNILVDSKFRAKVADFGLTQKKNLGGTGTPYWMAPELLRKQSANSAASDVYSLGIVFYEVFARKNPYDGEVPAVVLEGIKSPKIRKRPPVPSQMPVPFQSLMVDALQEEPERRPTMEEFDIRLKRIELNPQESDERKTISLYDIFPKHIAETLRAGEPVESEYHEIVTIFFSDIVGFTTITASLTPKKVADLLDRLYTKFDELSRKHGVFKVETIGDAYMAVTNLEKDQIADHGKRIVAFALEAIKAANATAIDLNDISKGNIDIRVGFHSGSVVSDVVGTRNPRYCLFGDTVNTASRMESTSQKNRIHCSEIAAEILREQDSSISLRLRGVIPIKGKGKMKTYWVNEKEHYEANNALPQPSSSPA